MRIEEYVYDQHVSHGNSTTSNYPLHTSTAPAKAERSIDPIARAERLSFFLQLDRCRISFPVWTNRLGAIDVQQTGNGILPFALSLVVLSFRAMHSFFMKDELSLDRPLSKFVERSTYSSITVTNT